MESNEVNSSFFPSPPSRYLQFTRRNLNLAKSLSSSSHQKKTHLQQQESFRDEFSLVFDASIQRQNLINLTNTVDNEINHSSSSSCSSFSSLDEKDLKDLENLDLKTLIQPPNLEWIRQRGGWTVFGDWEAWPGMASRAMLEGMPKLYDENMERKDALNALLNTMIHSYIRLLNSLGMQGPPSLNHETINPNSSSSNHHSSSSNTLLPSNPDSIVSHIELTAFNMHGLCNELRPRQARETLKLMMKEQAKEKREKARLVLKTCEELKTQLMALKGPDDPNDISNRFPQSSTKDPDLSQHHHHRHGSVFDKLKSDHQSHNDNDDHHHHHDEDWQVLLSAATDI